MVPGTRLIICENHRDFGVCVPLSSHRSYVLKWKGLDPHDIDEFKHAKMVRPALLLPDWVGEHWDWIQNTHVHSRMESFFLRWFKHRKLAAVNSLQLLGHGRRPGATDLTTSFKILDSPSIYLEHRGPGIKYSTALLRLEILKDIIDQWVRTVGTKELRASEDRSLVSDTELSDDACAEIVDYLASLFAHFGLKLPLVSKFKVSCPNFNQDFRSLFNHQLVVEDQHK